MLAYCIIQALNNYKSEKDALEADIFRLQQVNVQLDKRNEKLEIENQELTAKRDSLLGM